MGGKTPRFIKTLLEVGIWNCIVCSSGGVPTQAVGAGVQNPEPACGSGSPARTPLVVGLSRSSQPPSDLRFSIHRMGLKAGLELLFLIQGPGIAKSRVPGSESPSHPFLLVELTPLPAYLLRVHERLPLGQGPRGKQS